MRIALRSIFAVVLYEYSTKLSVSNGCYMDTVTCNPKYVYDSRLEFEK